MAYAKGYLFARSVSGLLYRIDTTTWTSNQVTVQPGYDLSYSSSGYIVYNLFDTPSGQLGVMNNGVNPTVRIYNVSADGLTLTWDRDVTVTSSWASSVSERGIASDGTYLYRIVGNNYQVYNLNTGALAYDGSSDSTWIKASNGTSLAQVGYITRDHATGRYIIGDIGSFAYLITPPTPTFQSTYSGFIGTDTDSVITGTPTFTGTAATAINAGSYSLSVDVSALSSSNYSFAAGASSTFTINKAVLTVTADAKSKTYDGQVYSGYTSTITGFAASDTTSVVSGTTTYTGTATTAKNYSASNYVITPDVSNLSAANYTFAAANGVLTINKAVLTVTADNKSKTYDNAIFTGSGYTSTITGFVNGETTSVVTNNPTYTGTAAAAKAAGTYVITPVVSGLVATNYSFAAANGALTINKAVLTINPQNFTSSYSGKSQVPAPTTYLTNTPYTLSGNGANPYIINTDLGQNWSFQADFKVNSSSGNNWFFSYGTLSDGILLSTQSSYGFYLKGAAKTGPLDVFGGSTTSTFVKLLVTYTNDGSTGTMKVYVENVLKWTMTNSGTLSPANKSIRLGSAAHANSEGFDGQVKNIVITSGVAPFSYVVAGLASGDTNSVIGGNVSYTNTATTATNIGTYPLGVDVSNLTSTNYTFVSGADATLTISPATLTVTAGAKSKTYDGQIYSGGYTSTITGYVNGETSSVVSGSVTNYTGAAITATNYSATGHAITPDISPLSASNYTFAAANGVLTINKAVLTVTADAKSKTYDNAVFATSGFTSTITGYVNNETISVVGGSPTYTGAATTAKAAGTYVITPVVSALTATNYSFAAANGALTINKAVLTITPQNKTRTYDGLVQGGGQAGTPYLTDAPYTLLSDGTNPYIISTDLGQNWSFQADFKINSNNNFSTWFSYGSYGDGVLLRHLRGDGFYLKGSNDVMSPDVFGGNTTSGAYVNVRVTYSTTGTTGTLKVYVADVLKWTLTTTGPLSPADKTIRIGSAHHANNEGLDGAVKNIIISDGSANYSYAVTGLATGDTSSVITGAVAYSGPATSAVNIGNYSFSSVVTGLTASNYTFVPGTDATLTINPATLTVTADAKSKTYDGQIYSGGYTSTITGFKNGETSSVITGSVTNYTGTAIAAVNYNASNYVITPDISPLSAANYTFAAANGVLTINKAVLTVTADPKTKVYDNQLYTVGNSFTSTITGYVNSEDISVVTNAPTYTGTATTNVTAGTWVITPVVTGLVATNYSFTPVNNNLVITKSVLTVTPQPKTKTYDGKALGVGSSVTRYLTDTTHALSSTGYLSPYVIDVDLGNNWSFEADYRMNHSDNYNSLFSYGHLNNGDSILVNNIVGGISLNRQNIADSPVLFAARGFSETPAIFTRVRITYINDGSNGTLTVYADDVLKFTKTVAGGFNVGSAYKSIRIGSATHNYARGIPGEVKNIVITNNTSPYNYVVSGMAAGDPTPSIGGTLLYNNTATTATNIGTYPLSIDVSNLTSTSYTFVNGADTTLTINRATLTVTAEAKSKTYDSLIYSGGYSSTITGYMNGETGSVVTGAVTNYTGTAIAAVNYNASNYVITPDISPLSADNYTFVAANGVLTINKAVLTVTPDAKTKVYDNKVYTNSLPFTSTITGYFGSDTGSVITGVPTYSGTATTETAGGSYTITSVIGAMSATNYTFASANGTLTITKSVLTVTPQTKTKTYDGKALGVGSSITRYLTDTPFTLSSTGYISPYIINTDLGSNWSFEADYTMDANNTYNTLFSYGHPRDGILVRNNLTGTSYYEDK
ncbi:MAG: beta strand repeat-containing protein, partial [Planctomycetota bacterium]